MIEKARGNPRIIWNQLKKLTGQQNEDKKILELKVKEKSINNPAVTILSREGKHGGEELLSN